MCDTWVALKNATTRGQMIFAKNSDRPIFDCQPLQLEIRRKWLPGSTIQTSYLEIPQVDVTYAHLGSKPYWCWGYEEGINEWGLVIGNEAIYTKPLREIVEAAQRGQQATPGLLGMDLIRLALERCRSAHQAVELMGSLVETYGLFGSGNPGLAHGSGSYDNAFLVADPDEAWIVETAGQRWAAQRLQQGCRSISNEPSIRSQWELGSPDLEAYARQKGWWLDKPAAEPGPAFDFAHSYIDEKTSRQVSHLRVMRSQSLLEERLGNVDPPWMMRIARDHYEGTFLEGPYFDAANPDFLSLCMHVSSAGFTWGNTASSCVAVLPGAPNELPVFWWTPGPPCNGCYVPFFPHSSRLPGIVSNAGGAGNKVTPAIDAREDTFAPDSYWWLFRQLNDRVKGDAVRSLPGYYPKRNRVVRAAFDALEHTFMDQLTEVLSEASRLREQDPAGMAALLDTFTAACVDQVLARLSELVCEFQ